MTAGLNDIRDVVRGAIASFFGFGGRLIARALLMVIAGRAFGVEPLGVLGQVAAITEISAAIGVVGLKRGLLDLLSADEIAGRSLEARIVEALSISAIFSIGIAITAAVIWRLIFPGHISLAPFFLIAAPAIVFTDVALTAVKHKRIIGWDVWSRGIAEPWSFLALAVIFLNLNMRDNGLVTAYVGSTVFAALFAGAGLLRTYGFMALVRSRPHPRRWFYLVKKSAPVGVTDVGVMALRRVDLVVLSLFASADIVGLYYMVQQLASIPQKTYALFEPMLSPVIARLHNKLDTKKIKANLIGVCRWVFIVQLAISIPMMVFGDDLLSLFGDAFTAGGVVLATILIAELIDGSFLATETPLVFAKPKLPPFLLVATIIIEVIAIAALSQLWGAEGAAIGFLVAIVSLNASRLILTAKHLEIRVINTSFIMPAFLAIMIAAVTLAVRHIANIENGIVISLLFVGCICVFLALVRWFALTKSDRILFRVFMQRRRRERSKTVLA